MGEVYLHICKWNAQDVDKWGNIVDSSIPPLWKPGVEKYQRKADRFAAGVVRLLLITELKERRLLHFLQNTMLTGENKPRFEDQNVHFNFSHSSGVAVCSFSSIPNGVDVEVLRQLDLGSMQSALHHDEWNIVEKTNESLNQFFTFWTIKESIIKANGGGLRIPMHSFSVLQNPVLLDGIYYSYSSQCIDSCFIATACTGLELTTELKELELESIVRL